MRPYWAAVRRVAEEVLFHLGTHSVQEMWHSLVPLIPRRFNTSLTIFISLLLWTCLCVFCSCQPRRASSLASVFAEERLGNCSAQLRYNRRPQARSRPTMSRATRHLEKLLHEFRVSKDILSIFCNAQIAIWYINPLQSPERWSRLETPKSSILPCWNGIVISGLLSDSTLLQRFTAWCRSWHVFWRKFGNFE